MFYPRLVIALAGRVSFYFIDPTSTNNFKLQDIKTCGQQCPFPRNAIKIANFSISGFDPGPGHQPLRKRKGFYDLIFMWSWCKKRIKTYKFLAIRIKSVIFTALKWIT